MCNYTVAIDNGNFVKCTNTTSSRSYNVTYYGNEYEWVEGPYTITYAGFTYNIPQDSEMGIGLLLTCTECVLILLHQGCGTNQQQVLFSRDLSEVMIATVLEWMLKTTQWWKQVRRPYSVHVTYSCSGMVDISTQKMTQECPASSNSTSCSESKKQMVYVCSLKCIMGCGRYPYPSSGDATSSSPALPHIPVFLVVFLYLICILT